MSKLENIFTGCRDHSLEELTDEGSISNKEKLLLRAVFENASNIINSFIAEFKAAKKIGTNDFEWVKLLYVSVCVQELHDILDRIAKTDDIRIKNTLDVSKGDLTNHLKKVFGGKDIDSYVNSVAEIAESLEKTSSNYNEFVVGRTRIIYLMFTKNQVRVENISSDKLLEISDKNYKNSIVNFAKICLV